MSTTVRSALIVTICDRSFILDDAYTALLAEASADQIFTAMQRRGDAAHDLQSLAGEFWPLRLLLDTMQLPSMSVGDTITRTGPWGYVSETCTEHGWTLDCHYAGPGQ